MTRRTATLAGFGAVFLWSLLALLTVWTEPVPPLQLTAMCFAIAGFAGLVWVAATRSVGLLRAVPWYVYVFGTAGLFGYHFLYFSALRLAPPAEAGLIAYLWPLLIVLFSGLLPGERLRAGHVAGAVAGFAGAATLLADGIGTLEAGSAVGYGLALLCAITWAGYSVLSRRLRDVPTASVAVFCLLSAGLAAAAHLAIETTRWPQDPIGWVAVLALGIGPVGLAFFVWDVGMKTGNIQILGAASYAAPLFSTLVLVAAGVAAPGWALAAATLLIVSGAVLAAMADRRPRVSRR